MILCGCDKQHCICIYHIIYSVYIYIAIIYMIIYILCIYVYTVQFDSKKQ